MPCWQFDAIGTCWEIETEAPLAAAERARIVDLIDDFDREWSRFRPDSMVSHLAMHGGEVPLPVDAAPMLDTYRALSRATGGAVNPLVGESMVALGYDARLSLIPDAPHAAPREWEKQLRWSDGVLSLAAPATIDVGALGKGRLVDLVLAGLGSVPGRVIVDASGDLATRGAPVRVALEHPYDPTSAIGVVTVQDAALCASATNRRAWGDGLHHVLDARTGVPVHTWAATWAVAADAMTADAMATALFFEGGAELAARSGVSWVRMSTDGRVESSAPDAAELFVQR